MGLERDTPRGTQGAQLVEGLTLGCLSSYDLRALGSVGSRLQILFFPLPLCHSPCLHLSLPPSL